MTDEETKLLVAGHIARVIKKAREEKGWSVYKLARKSGIDTATIYRIEDGLNTARIDTLHKVFATLKLEIQIPLPI